MRRWRLAAMLRMARPPCSLLLLTLLTLCLLLLVVRLAGVRPRLSPHLGIVPFECRQGCQGRPRRRSFRGAYDEYSHAPHSFFRLRSSRNDQDAGGRTSFGSLTNHSTAQGRLKERALSVCRWLGPSHENDGVVGACSFSLFAAQGLRGTDNPIYSELIDVLRTAATTTTA
jgi:hypothetical protein